MKVDAAKPFFRRVVGYCMKLRTPRFNFSCLCLVPFLSVFYRPCTLALACSLRRGISHPPTSPSYEKFIPDLPTNIPFESPKTIPRSTESWQTHQEEALEAAPEEPAVALDLVATEVETVVVDVDVAVLVVEATKTKRRNGSQ